jgi:hypothetical protein
LYRINNGARVFLASYNTNATTLWQYLRFQTNGSNIYVKLWPAGESEPSWQISVTDTSPLLDNGALQLGLFWKQGEHKVFIDDLELSQV